jgi:enoyl-[acyl-carrier protein] reductase II
MVMAGREEMGSMLRTPLCDLLQIPYPILQGALGPHDTSDLALAVCRAGGLGVLSTVDTDDMYGETRRQIRKLAKGGSSFGVNLPVNSATSAERLQAVLDELKADPTLRQSLKAVITSAGSPAWCAAQLKEAQVSHLHVVASTRHARKAAEAGCAAVIAEGHESGGHVASGSGVTTMALVPAVIEAVDIPVVAAGGFIDGKGLAAALALGAAGIQMGTRFYMTAEASFIHPNIRSALLRAEVSDTVVVPGVYGENRHWSNAFTQELLGLVANNAAKDAIGDLKRKGRQAKLSGAVNEASVPIGMAVGRIHDLPTVQDVMRKTIEGARNTIKQLSEYL